MLCSVLFVSGTEAAAAVEAQNALQCMHIDLMHSQQKEFGNFT
jgi:hypothetical protein